MSSKQYEQMLRDTVHLLVETTRDPSIYGGGDYQRGYVQAMYATLSLVRSQIDRFDLDASRAGMGDFDPAEWRELGALYWDMRSGGRLK
jgi:hypothetical protein